MTASPPLHRRGLITAGAASLFAASRSLGAVTDPRGAAGALAAIEAEIGGRVGVAAWNTGTGAWVTRRADERFAMCSTFKLFLAATVLDLISHGALTAARRIPFSRADLLPHSPVTSAHVDEIGLSVGDLCAAAVEESDNGAANLLLRLVGGPAALTRHLRRLGDPTTRLDRTELALNSNLPGDARDTSTPKAYVRTMHRILLGDGLSAASRRQLEAWMVDCRTGLDRLRAGLPLDWKSGDKTGSGERGAVNDVAILRPPGRPPILVAVFLSGSSRPVEALSATHAEIARAVVTTLG
jgi:beta-lactamase class A